MTKRHDEDQKILNELISEIAADEYAVQMDDILLDIADLNPDVCPPDRRFFRGEREAWVYEHGNIAELVFVKAEG